MVSLTWPPSSTQTGYADTAAPPLPTSAPEPEHGDLAAIDRKRAALPDRNLVDGPENKAWVDVAHRTGTCGSEISGSDVRNCPASTGFRPSSHGSLYESTDFCTRASISAAMPSASSTTTARMF